MDSLLPNNKIPREYRFDEIAKALLESSNGVAVAYYQIGVGNQTTAEFIRVGHDDPQKICIRYHETVILHLFDDGNVTVNNGGHQTETLKRRVNLALQPMGMKILSVKRRWKVYRSSDGRYKDYHNGITLNRKTVF